MIIPIFAQFVRKPIIAAENAKNQVLNIVLGVS